MATFKEIAEKQEEIVEMMDGMRGEIDTANETALRIQQEFDNYVENGELPPHHHKIDRIAVQDLQGGFSTLNSTPTHTAPNGLPAFYTVGSTAYMAVKMTVGSTTSWHKVSLDAI